MASAGKMPSAGRKITALRGGRSAAFGWEKTIPAKNQANLAEKQARKHSWHELIIDTVWGLLFCRHTTEAQD
jgi:hypothetical protein